MQSLILDHSWLPVVLWLSSCWQDICFKSYLHVLSNVLPGCRVLTSCRVSLNEATACHQLHNLLMYGSCPLLSRGAEQCGCGLGRRGRLRSFHVMVLAGLCCHPTAGSWARGFTLRYQKLSKTLRSRMDPERLSGTQAGCTFSSLKICSAKASFGVGVWQSIAEILLFFSSQRSQVLRAFTQKVGELDSPPSSAGGVSNPHFQYWGHAPVLEHLAVLGGENHHHPLQPAAKKPKGGGRGT